MLSAQEVLPLLLGFKVNALGAVAGSAAVARAATANDVLLIEELTTSAEGSCWDDVVGIGGLGRDATAQAPHAQGITEQNRIPGRQPLRCPVQWVGLSSRSTKALLQ